MTEPNVDEAKRNLSAMLAGMCVNLNEELQSGVKCGNCQSILNGFDELRKAAELLEEKVKQLEGKANES